MESGARRTIALSATPVSGVWGSVVDFPEFSCASLRAILLRASGTFRDAKQIPETSDFLLDLRRSELTDSLGNGP